MSLKAKAFQAANISLQLGDPDEREIRTIAQLIEFNSQQNANHVFCVQTRRGQGSLSVTHFQLKHAILQCSDWLTATVKDIELPHADADGVVRRGPPVALAMDSDLGLLVHLLSLLSLGVPVLLLSARLSSNAIMHLMLETSAKFIVGAPTHRNTVHEALATIPSERPKPRFYEQEAVESFLTDGIADTGRSICGPHHYLADTDRNVLILHSSGTTGMPKPIYCSHRYLLGFAACHAFVDPTRARAPNVSTLPLFHGYGLVAPCLSLGVGMTLILPISSSVPTGSSIIEVLRREHGRSLMTVPSILEDIASAGGPKSVDALVDLNFVAFGGGLIKTSVGEKLSSAGVKLLNHYGATEIGPIAPIFSPPEDYDYRFFRMRQDMDLELSESPKSADGQRRYRMTALPFGWTKNMVVQDELVSNPLHPQSDFSAIGRNDDMIVLATGEKVIPHVLESRLSETKDVRAAIAFGDGQFELGVIVEPQRPISPNDHQSFIYSLWPVIVQINKVMDGHAQISATAAVIIASLEKPLPRSDKGSVMRKEAYRVFEEEISQAYRDLENSALDPSAPALDMKHLEDGVKSLIQNNLGWKLESTEWGPEDDLFQLGMDSLQAVKLRRLLLSSVSGTSANHLSRQRDFIYAHPTVSQLASALRGTIVDESRLHIRDFVDQYSLHAPSKRPNVILLTGTTGSLGASLLAHIVKSPRFSRVICIIRSHGDSNGPEYQAQALRAHKIHLDSHLWDKVEVVQTNPTLPSLGLTDTEYKRLVGCVSHIIHCAWPMDFKMMLPSFKGQFQFLHNLLDLAVDASKFLINRPRLLFISSVATVGHYKTVYGHSQVPETSMVNNECINDFGYGEAKLVCERIIENARSTHGFKIDASFVRLGQITGSRLTGYWNPKEHLPAMLKSSQHIDALPIVNGTLSWLPVDCAAEVLHDLILQESYTELVYHLENPVRQPWHELLAMLAPLVQVQVENSLPFKEWVTRIGSCAATTDNTNLNPAQKLVEFFDADFERMAGGDVTLDMSNSLQASSSLKRVEGISATLVAAYVESWKDDGLFNK